MYTDWYPAELLWAYDGVGEGAARPAPRQGRSRAHPCRIAAAVPRSGHQQHRAGPALLSGEVSKRTFYQHFTSKDELIAEHLRRFDPDILPEVFDRADLTPRERLLAVFDIHAPLCPFIAAAVEINDPGHPARVQARDYKKAFAARITETAREAGATNPEQLGEQLALLLDGASARSRVLNSDAFATAAAMAVVLIDDAVHWGGTFRRSPRPHVLDVVVGLHQTDEPVASLALVCSGVCAVDVDEGLPHSRGHLGAVTTDVDVGVLRGVTEKFPDVVGVGGDPVLHVPHSVLRCA